MGPMESHGGPWNPWVIPNVVLGRGMSHGVSHGCLTGYPARLRSNANDALLSRLFTVL